MATFFRASRFMLMSRLRSHAEDVIDHAGDEHECVCDREVSQESINKMQNEIDEGVGKGRTFTAVGPAGW